MAVFMDLDEVFADFMGSALRLHGWTREGLEEVRPPGVWCAASSMGMSPEEFWRPITEQGERFWIDIEPLPWATELVELLAPLEEWYIVSSPSRHLSSRTGKLKWVQQHLPQKLDHCFLTSRKALFGRIPGAWLVDDRVDNLTAFTKAGGNGIVFPSWGNHLSHMAHDPLPYVAKQLGAE